MSKHAPTLERTLGWLHNQVAPSLAFVTQAEGGSVDWFYDLLASGRPRMSPRQRELLSALRESVGAA